jgi:hypothetical protein
LIAGDEHAAQTEVNVRMGQSCVFFPAMTAVDLNVDMALDDDSAESNNT